ncbi:MAG: tetratricopeptide repeat protein [Rhodoferax sp.]|nr:tetratricopeptide repeat protein [Rhodoferax sp.]
MQVKPRLLSYGSFVWIQDIFGEGWWKQRIFNIGLHIATAFVLYMLALELLHRTEWEENTRSLPQFSSSLAGAARMGVVLWAFNPVAVYAVAYLIQRSILMATLFVAMACWSYVRGLVTGQLRWRVLAAVCYVLAVASKEHAVTAILLTVPLFVFVRRPSLQRVIGVMAVAGLVLVATGTVLFQLYGSIVGTVFDETSRAFAAQLALLRPGIDQQIYPLSIINQASLFFQYGLMWFLPNVNWMSVDIRPSFPLTLWSWHMAGALAWVSTLILGVWLVIRRSDVWGLIGLCLLIPCLLFLTEFATVWLQDPFVLYRSYLWAVPIPIFFALPLVGTSRRTFYAVGLIVAGLFAALSFERINSLQTPTTTWADASAKIDKQGPANAVGRWRSVLNLAAEYQDRGDYQEALRLFSQAEALGEPLGSARFNMGVSLQQLQQHPQALENFVQAEGKGFTEAALYYHRGESQYALRRFAEAFESFTKALQHRQGPEAAQFTRMRQAEAAVGSQNFDAAITAYQTLIQQAPDKQRYKIGLSMAFVGKKDYAASLAILTPAIAQHPTGPAYYARALTHFYLGNRVASAQDLELAMRAEPANPIYRKLQQQLNESPAKATPQAVTKSTAKP